VGTRFSIEHLADALKKRGTKDRLRYERHVKLIVPKQRVIRISRHP
jgi:hypothetical protein